ncbi:hypothetical protein HK103_000493 [Boothiomyces macroporosus]|uniref:Xylanolytic transcriptional activator regulatory domain-containing protein n=1 Tax=Boothiomyces macroporosus TaxID=261099 RepID=A0AAD5UFN4_9FUNG|nr:hypothetical protein HK103_000493 [Boothiomyces macroporosus]
MKETPVLKYDITFDNSYLPTPMISPVEDMDSWNFYSFPSIRTTDGNLTLWTKVYFAWVNTKLPLFTESWFMENIKEIPVILLHSMYALTCTAPIAMGGSWKAGDANHSQAKKLLPQVLDIPNPFTAAAFLLMGIYADNSSRSITSVSYYGLAIRMTQRLGIHRGGEVLWFSQNGTLMSNESMPAKLFCDHLWWHAYEYDYYSSKLAKLPCIIVDESDILIGYPTGSVQNLMQDTYHSYYYSLIRIAKRVEHHLKTSMGDIYQQDQLHNDLTRWVTELPRWLQVIPQVYSTDDTSTTVPSWRIAYLHCFCHYLFIQIRKGQFIMSLSDPLANGNNPYTATCFESASVISKILKIILTHNPTFTGIPDNIASCIFEAAGVQVISTLINGQSPGLTKTLDMMLNAFGLVSMFSSTAEKYAETLKKWIANPNEALHSF